MTTTPSLSKLLPAFTLVGGGRELQQVFRAGTATESTLRAMSRDERRKILNARLTGVDVEGDRLMPNFLVLGGTAAYHSDSKPGLKYAQTLVDFLTGFDIDFTNDFNTP